jgi:hypothetical protein
MEYLSKCCRVRSLLVLRDSVYHLQHTAQRVSFFRSVSVGAGWCNIMRLKLVPEENLRRIISIIILEYYTRWHSTISGRRFGVLLSLDGWYNNKYTSMRYRGCRLYSKVWNGKYCNMDTEDAVGQALYSWKKKIKYRWFGSTVSNRRSVGRITRRVPI